MRGFLPLIHCNLERQPAPLLAASDAAGGAGHPYGGDQARHGAWCLAAAQPDYEELQAAWAQIETVGRGGTLPLELRGSFGGIVKGSGNAFAAPHQFASTLVRRLPQLAEGVGQAVAAPIADLSS